MKVLGIETSTVWGSVALRKGGRTVSMSKWCMPEEGHLPYITVAISHVLSIGKVKLESIDLIGVSIGPGSFTGLRVGLSSAKALSLAYSIPIKGVPSLKVVASGVYCPEGAINVIRDAKRGLVYMAVYRWEQGSLETVKSEKALTPEKAAFECESGVAVGDGVERYREKFRNRKDMIILPYEFFTPSADKVCALAEKEFCEKGPDDVDALTPFYIRPSPPEEEGLKD